MKISIILNLVLAAALVAVSVYCVRLVNGGAPQGKDTGKTETSAPADSVAAESAYDCIMTRSSVRAYTDEAVDDAAVEKLLRAGMAAPTARDARPWHFYVITERETLDKIAADFKNISMAAQAPMAIVVCGDMSKALDGEGQAYWIQDCSAATENILLAAHSLGLGAVWCGIYPITERVDQLRELLQIPSNLIPLNVIPIGHPSRAPKVKDKWDPSAVTPSLE